MTRKKLDFAYLRNLAEHSLRTPTFAHGSPDKMTIAQFCMEIRLEMLYQYHRDVADGLVEKLRTHTTRPKVRT